MIVLVRMCFGGSVRDHLRGLRWRPTWGLLGSGPDSGARVARNFALRRGRAGFRIWATIGAGSGPSTLGFLAKTGAGGTNPRASPGPRRSRAGLRAIGGVTHGSMPRVLARIQPGLVNALFFASASASIAIVAHFIPTSGREFSWMPRTPRPPRVDVGHRPMLLACVDCARDNLGILSRGTQVLIVVSRASITSSRQLPSVLRPGGATSRYIGCRQAEALGEQIHTARVPEEKQKSDVRCETPLLPF